jgi:hypothetical protein
MVRTIAFASLVLLAFGCPGGGQKPPPPPPGDKLEVTDWSPQAAGDVLHRAAASHAFVIVTLGQQAQPSLVWISVDGSTLPVAYCLAADQLEDVRAATARQRDPQVPGYVELTLKPGVRTQLCPAPPPPAAATAAPPPPPPPPAPPQTAGLAPLTCQSDLALCNFVLPNPEKKGPAGIPPLPIEILKLFDRTLLLRGLFVQPRALPGGG